MFHLINEGTQVPSHSLLINKRIVLGVSMNNKDVEGEVKGRRGTVSLCMLDTLVPLRV